MALTLGDRPVRPLTAEEAMLLVESGVIGEDERVELLHGVLTQMSPQHPPHAVVVQRLTRWLAPALASGRFDVRVQLPLRVPDPTSLPEPDVAVIGRGDGAEIDHPRTAVLVIEIADSSLHIDTRIKPPLYASAGVEDLWVVDVRAQRLIHFREPGHDGYATRDVIDAPSRVERSDLEVEPLDLNALFAGIPR